MSEKVLHRPASVGLLALKKNKNVLAIVLLSGGLDSAVALYWAKAQGWKIQGLTFSYYLRSRREVQAADKIARLNDLENRKIRLDFLKELEDSKINNPFLKGTDSAYISSRNIIFYGIASSFAELSNAKYIVAGHNRDDVRNFPDSSIAFFDSFNATTKIGLISGARTGRVILPLGRLSKKQVVTLGAKLGVPFQLTWSCYRSSQRPCGVCHSCELRASAFRDAGIKDPLVETK